MAAGPQSALLPDGKRLHLHYGPIDLVIGAAGTRREVGLAYQQARARFDDILPVLVDELAMLRRPVAAPRWRPDGPVARRMMAAAWPHRDVFVTPMAAVAGAVAESVARRCSLTLALAARLKSSMAGISCSRGTSPWPAISRRPERP